LWKKEKKRENIFKISKHKEVFPNRPIGSNSLYISVFLGKYRPYRPMQERTG
jgi:hypothetical protein